MKRSNHYRARMLRSVAVSAFALASLAGTLPAAAQESYEPNVHVINYGDTLSHIADAYGLTIDELVAMNGLDDPDLIIAGEVLVLASPTPVEPVEPVEVEETWTEEPVVEETWDDTTDDDTEEFAWTPPPCCPDYVDPWTVRWYLVDAATRYGWDPTLIMAQAWQESYWRQDEVSWVGAVGVMQVMPATADGMNDWYFDPDVDIWNSVADNIEAGVAYLTMLYETTGSVELALAAYYQGWYSLQTDGWFPDTHQYVDRILMFQAMFQSGELTGF